MGLKGLGDLMQQAQAMQGKMQELQQEIANAEVTGEAGAGLVKVVLNGANEARRVDIDPSLLTEDKEVLEDLVAAAFNDAVRRVSEMQKEKMGELTAGMGMPGGGFSLGSLFGK